MDEEEAVMQLAQRSAMETKRHIVDSLRDSLKHTRADYGAHF